MDEVDGEDVREEQLQDFGGQGLLHGGIDLDYGIVCIATVVNNALSRGMK